MTLAPLVFAALLQPAEAHPWADAAVTLGAAGGWLVLDQLHPDLVATDCPCARGEVNALDRVAVDEHLSDGEVAADITAGVTLAAPLLLLAFTAPDEHAYINDVTLVVESAAIAGLLTQVAKTATGRAYPYMHRPAAYESQNDDGVNYASFWSGHTAVPMAAAVTFAWQLSARSPRSAWRWVAWTAGPALALAAGALQVGASNHFPTDVAAGALGGAGVGVANPWLRAAF